VTPNKQLERTVIRRHVRAASASLHYALAARFTRQRAAAQLRELSARSISFSRSGNCLTFSARANAIESAALAAFGAAPPSGLSIGSANPSETVRLLEQGGVRARIMTYGRDWVVWDAADADKAETTLNMPPERRDALKRMRENQLPLGVTLPPPQ
jgi:hypothetical protein